MSRFGNILALHMYLNYSNKGHGGFGDTKVDRYVINCLERKSFKNSLIFRQLWNDAETTKFGLATPFFKIDLKIIDSGSHNLLT